MRIKYLGTASETGLPALFCNCDFCLKIKKYGGRNYRYRNQVLIDDVLLLDFSQIHFLISMQKD